MPNWCEGTLKLRGTKENILRFMNEKLVSRGYEKKIEGGLPLIKETNIKFLYDESDQEIEWDKELLKGKHIRIQGVRRLFIHMPDYIELYEEPCIVVLDVKVAWGIQPFEKENYLKLAEDYAIDLRFKGYECGGQFEQLLEIINGKITKYEEITYNDYEWECDFPKMGG